MYALQPEFCSVTFGAGGSTQEGTLQAVSEMREQFVRWIESDGPTITRHVWRALLRLLRPAEAAARPRAQAGIMQGRKASSMPSTTYPALE